MIRNSPIQKIYTLILIIGGLFFTLIASPMMIIVPSGQKLETNNYILATLIFILGLTLFYFAKKIDNKTSKK